MSLQTDLAYLASQGIDISRIKTAAYARRFASAVQKAVAAGKPVPTRTELRGHARAPIVTLPRSGHQLEQFTIFQPPDRPLDTADIKNLFNYAKKQKPTRENFLVVISGWAKKYPGVSFPGGSEKLLTRSHWEDKQGMAAWLKSNPNGTAEDLANWYFPGSDWTQVVSVGIAYPEKERLR